MGRARRIELETRVFEKAGDASEFYKQMLHRYPIDARVSDSDAIDLMALLNLHDEKDEKIGAGVSHFEIGLPPDFPGRCFWIVRTDGTKIDFSFKHCLRA